MYFKKFSSFINVNLLFLFFSTLFLFLCISSAEARQVTLTWDPNSESDLSHYIVYWGLSSDNYSENSGDIGLVTEYSVDIPDDGQTYFFAVTAVNTSDLESDYSNEVNTGEISLPPVANAGGDQNVDEGQQVVLDGSNSTDPDGSIVSWQWTQIGGTQVSLNNQTSMSPSFNSPSVDSAGDILTFKLTVTDSDGLTSTDTCIVNVANIDNTPNEPPVANAGADQNVDEGMQVVLDGSGSVDPDGSIVSWQWTQIGGTQVSLNNPTSMTPSFTSPSVDSAGDTLTFKLTVTDSDGSTSTDTCIVNVANIDNTSNEPPVANAGPDQNVEKRVKVVLDGSGSVDPDGSIVSWRWTQIDGTRVYLSRRYSMTPSFTSPSVSSAGETLTFELTVTDAQGLQSTDLCIVNIIGKNNPPFANAGTNQNVSSGELVILDGSGSADSDGNISSYNWIQTGGTSVMLSDPTAVQPDFVAPSVGPDGEILIFRLLVKDNDGLQSSSKCEVEINPPTETQVLSVKSNWNLISISNGSQNISIENALGPIMTGVISVWSYDNGAWQVYNPANPGSSDLLEIKPGKGLWVNMRENAELAMPGDVSQDPISLSEGWNLVGSASSGPQDISTAISSIAKYVKSVWAYQDGQWKVYDPKNPGFSDLTNMEPGSGYWINVTSPCSWTN